MLTINIFQLLVIRIHFAVDWTLPSKNERNITCDREPQSSNRESDALTSIPRCPTNILALLFFASN